MNNLISLGYNCEISFQIQKYAGKLDSRLFSWAFVLDDEKFLRALENIDDIFTHGVHFHMPSNNMFYDEEYDITFHGRTPKNVMFDENGNIKDQAAYDECLEELRSRLAHLKKKTIQDFTSPNKKIYFRKLRIQPRSDGTVDYESIVSFVTRLDALLNKLVRNGTYRLVIVVEKKHMSKELKKLKSKTIRLRTVDYYAPASDTKNGADYRSWKKILREFSWF